MTLHVTVAGWLLGPPSGANRRLMALLAHLGPRLAPGERITVLHRPDFAPPPLRGIAWQPIAIPAGPTWQRARAERRLLGDRLRALGATVHDHGFLPLPRLPVPVCLLVHDVRAADGASARPRWLARAVLRRSCTRAAAIVVPSAFTAQRIATLVPHAPPIAIVANGVDLPAAAPATPTVRAVPERGFVLHVGHLETRKNLAVLLAALARLPAERRPELWLAGRDAGALAGLRRTATGLGIADRVHALGVVDDQELARLYAAARAVVVPSRYEGFGLPVLEAFAHGTPVLASACAALPEVAGDAATMLPPADPVAWATALAGLADAVAIGDSGKRRERAEVFAWDRAAATLIAVYRRLDAGA